MVAEIIGTREWLHYCALWNLFANAGLNSVAVDFWTGRLNWYFATIDLYG